MSDFFKDVILAPADPILGIKQVFNEDPREKKIDLSIGIYQDEMGQIPTLEVVKEAFTRLAPAAFCGGYLPIEGNKDYTSAVQKLLFGTDSDIIKEGRVITVQALGGTGALKYAADFLNRYYPTSKVYISNPTWNNHRGVFERAGFQVETYPYYDPETKGIAFEALKEKFAQIDNSSIVVMHTCCHNPSGVDLSLDQWCALIEIIKTKKLIPVLDFAYQGFGKGVDEDAAPIREFIKAGQQVLVANSFSKNFSLYRRRIGALSIVCNSKLEAETVLTQIRTDIRTNNSNPPVDGAAIVATVLNDAELLKKWQEEVAVMRNRIADMRKMFVLELVSKGIGDRFKHVANQCGMFSFSGLTEEEVLALREKFGIYTIKNGRICLAAMNHNNMARIVDAVAAIVK